MKKKPAITLDSVTLSFAELDLDPRLAEALTNLGYEEPTDIQRQAIPLLLEGRDVVGQAATGTGKTAAFALPILQRLALAEQRSTAPQALILVPTRELAIQVAEATHRYGRALGVRVLPVYGGAPMEPQLRALKRGVDVVVATPGRALDHLNRRSLSLASISTVVLDEADEMMDMGFADDLTALLSATPDERQTVLFSATFAPRIAAIAAQYMTDPVRVTVARAPEAAAGEAPRVRQEAYIVPRAHKLAALSRVLDVEQPTSTMVFCRTRTEVDQLTETLNARGHRCASLHGGHNQVQRDRVMNSFRAKTTELLIATDVAARGLDVKHVSHVINFDVPQSGDSYIHRIGRTGRAGREGVAITFAEPREHRQLRQIEQQTRQRIVVKQVPTVADLNARRMATLQDQLREVIETGELDSVRVVVETLAAEYDIMDVAAAAVRHLIASSGGDDDAAEIPAQSEASRGGRGSEGRPSGRGSDGRASGRGTDGRASDGRSRSPRVSGGGAGGGGGGGRDATSRLFIGGGRKLKIRPGDIVGAIVTHTSVSATQLGAIKILDRHSLVEVPASAVHEIQNALAQKPIKGKKLTVRLDKPAR